MAGYSFPSKHVWYDDYMPFCIHLLWNICADSTHIEPFIVYISTISSLPWLEFLGEAAWSGVIISLISCRNKYQRPPNRSVYTISLTMRGSSHGMIRDSFKSCCTLRLSPIIITKLRFWKIDNGTFRLGSRVGKQTFFKLILNKTKITFF